MCLRCRQFTIYYVLLCASVCLFERRLSVVLRGVLLFVFEVFSPLCLPLYHIPPYHRCLSRAIRFAPFLATVSDLSLVAL